jgi:hypothetical protein
VTIDCTADTSTSNTGIAFANDSCDPSPSVSSNDVTTAGSCPQQYIITRRWIAVDACLNRDTCFQLITVQDTMRPVINCPANITIDCTADSTPANTGNAAASDTCDPAPTVSFSDVTAAGSCPQEYIITRRWIAADACLNQDTCFQTIFVQDTFKPVIACPADITITYPASTDPTNTGSGTATDFCDGSPVVTYVDSIPGQYCPPH